MKFYLKNWFIVLLVFLSTGLLFILLYLSEKTIESNVVLETSSKESVLSAENDQFFLVNRPSWGNKKAQVKVVGFFDFACSFCKESFFTLQDLKQNHQKDIYFQFRHFPVSNISKQAAMAGVCADNQGRFWDYANRLFSASPNFTSDIFKKIAADLELETAAFNDCLTQKLGQSTVEQDFNQGLDLGVSATPTFFINGYKVQGALPMETWQELLEKSN